MLLSYASRLVCLALCSAGLLLCVLEAVAWLAAPYFLKQDFSTNARRAEKSLFLLALFARLSPWLVVLGAWVPAYMRGEDNLAPERVGLTCIGGAACVLLWSLFCGLRVLRAWFATRRYRSVCQEAEAGFEGMPVLLHPSEQPVLAVVGILRVQIIVSKALLSPNRCSADALDVAFEHEKAHVRHRDNLKLLILSLLPHVPFARPRRVSLNSQWRLSAEMAADDEGSMGSANRSVLLAELLVSMARERQQSVPRGSFALLSCADDLRARVERLLQRAPLSDAPQKTSRSGMGRLMRCTLAVCAAVLAGLCFIGAELGHHLAEALLHLG